MTRSKIHGRLGSRPTCVPLAERTISRRTPYRCMERITLRVPRALTAGALRRCAALKATSTAS